MRRHFFGVVGLSICGLCSSTQAPTLSPTPSPRDKDDDDSAFVGSMSFYIILGVVGVAFCGAFIYVCYSTRNSQPETCKSGPRRTSPPTTINQKDIELQAIENQETPRHSFTPDPTARASSTRPLGAIESLYPPATPSTGSVTPSRSPGNSPMHALFDNPLRWRRSKTGKIMFGIAELQGRRPSMEDHTIVIQDLGLQNVQVSPQRWIAVYDGHNGNEASTFLSTRLHKVVKDSLEARALLMVGGEGEEGLSDSAAEVVDSTSGLQASDLEDGKLVTEVLTDAFAKTDAEFLDHGNQAGSTATCVLILGHHIYCANVGDSRTVLCRNGVSYPLSVDHKPSRKEELDRIVNSGGFVFNGRVMGQLAVSRSFGDEQYKQSISDFFDGELSEEKRLSSTDYSAPLVVSTPEIKHTPLSPGEDDFVLLACDGLFDVMTNDEVCGFILAELKQHGNASKAANAIANHAISARGSKDNVSVVLYLLKSKF